eukprot:2832939-Prymnesium_polylepis.3
MQAVTCQTECQCNDREQGTSPPGGPGAGAPVSQRNNQTLKNHDPVRSDLTRHRMRPFAMRQTQSATREW